MQPWQPGTTTDAGGRFTLDMAGKRQFMVLDKKRQNGAVYRLGANKRRTDREIKLGPLTTVKARVQVRGSDSKPIWSHVYVYLKTARTSPGLQIRSNGRSPFTFLKEVSVINEGGAITGVGWNGDKLHAIPGHPQMSKSRPLFVSAPTNGQRPVSSNLRRTRTM